MCGDIDPSRRPIFPRSNAIAPHSAYPSRLGLGLGAEIVEQKLTDRAVHYARRKDAYRAPQRYRCGDPRYSWHYITRSIDTLEQIGLINQVPGLRRPRRTGFQSVAWATDELMTLIGPLVDVSEHRGIPRRVETIVLRDHADKTEIDYTETPDTVAMREQVRILNDHLARLDLRRRGQKLDIPIGRRIFNESFERGGRFYCHGTSFQNMPAGQRRELELIIDGTAHPMIETDYSNLHIRMAYSEAGERIPAATSTPFTDSTVHWSRSR